MDLLNQLMAHPLDPDYAVVARRGERSTPRGWQMAIALVAVGALLALAAMQNLHTAPVRATERQELINRIDDASRHQDEVRTNVEERQAELRRLQQEKLGTTEQDRELRAEVERLELMAATVPVRGPGVAVVVDDAASADPKGRVMDIDLQQLVNGLWRAGAEAIAVNGHRVSSRTAIRGAGDAITVNYRSLTRPYRVEAIGDPKTLQARYAESPGGIWWTGLSQNYGLRHEVAAAKDLTLPSDPGLGLRYARKEGR